MSLTLIIIIITILVSVSAENNYKIKSDLTFYPVSIHYDRQWYRFFSHGLVHGDYLHLGVNMYALYLFGSIVEKEFTNTVFGQPGKILYLLMYISGLFFASLPTYLKHKDDSGYSAVGASGAIGSVVFAFILLNPLSKMGLLLIPIRIPGFLFGILYLAYSSYMDKRGRDNIGHSAHLWGSLYGFAYLIVMAAIFTPYHVLGNFVREIQYYIQNF